MVAIESPAEYVQSYLDSEIQLHELEDKLAPILWGIEDCNDVVFGAFVGRIHSLIAEYSNGDRTHSSLCEELAKTIRPFVQRKVHARSIQIVVGTPSKFGATSTSSSVPVDLDAVA